ncbi:hypothetical protein [Clostridium sp. FP1]|uniref:hypothetical protein n=1 Tax=Clostridium sp. FP1 TaxID=2724076 RepID=UPI0013E92BE7|nr:hypothetical protein [Clostridium sp. FP1]MBZ9637702.1 hypothetical protein [Clostridium sp. FP1]
MNKKIFALLSFIIIICIAFISYSRVYTIMDNEIQLKDNIIQFLNRPTVIVNKIDIKQELNLDNKKYILFIFNNTCGEAELTKGLTNKYKIESIRYGSSSTYFNDEIYKTNKGKYLIMTGENPDMKIIYARVTLDNKEYKISIPHQEYFISYCAIPIDTQLVYPSFNNTKLYNKNDADITDKISKVLFK